MKECCKKTDLKVRREFLGIMKMLSEIPASEFQRVIKIVVQTTEEALKEVKKRNECN